MHSAAVAFQQISQKFSERLFKKYLWRATFNVNLCQTTVLLSYYIHGIQIKDSA